MRWEKGAKAAFTTGEPWLPMGDASLPDVASCRADQRSILWFYRAMIALRRRLEPLRIGRYEPRRNEGDVLVFRRCADESAVTVFLNISDRPAEAAAPTGRIALSTTLERQDELVARKVKLRPYEGVILSEQ